VDFAACGNLPSCLRPRSNRGPVSGGYRPRFSRMSVYLSRRGSYSAFISRPNKPRIESVGLLTGFPLLRILVRSSPPWTFDYCPHFFRCLLLLFPWTYCPGSSLVYRNTLCEGFTWPFLLSGRSRQRAAPDRIVSLSSSLFLLFLSVLLRYPARLSLGQ